MKQTMVVKVSMKGEKYRSKALKIAVSLVGVESASLKGDDKTQIEVVGVGVDPVKLTSLLRKGVGYTELLSVAEKKEEKKEKEDPKPAAVAAPYVMYEYNPPYVMYEDPYGYAQQRYDPGCSIM